MSSRYRRTNAELAVIDDAIVAAVEADKPVTLRGVYYRVVSAGAVEKTEAGYDLIGRQLIKLRAAGRVSYWDIVDGTRATYRPRTYDGIDGLLADASKSYRRGLWADSRCDVMLFSEKDAITGVIYQVTDDYDVPLSIVRGYSSVTLAWKVAQSIKAAMKRRKQVYLYQLGDHDPSGVDAWRSFQKRVTEFVEETYLTEGWVFFERLAVTPEQIVTMSLPTRPTKPKDSRAAGFSGGSVEVDAIPASTLRQLVRDAVEQHVDAEALRITRIAEASEREVLTLMSQSHWSAD